MGQDDNGYQPDERLFAKYEEAARMIQELAMRQRGVGEMSVDDVDE